jgi:hypothetical protein
MTHGRYNIDANNDFNDNNNMVIIIMLIVRIVMKTVL